MIIKFNGSLEEDGKKHSWKSLNISKLFFWFNKLFQLLNFFVKYISNCNQLFQVLNIFIFYILINYKLVFTSITISGSDIVESFWLSRDLSISKVGSELFRFWPLPSTLTTSKVWTSSVSVMVKQGLSYPERSGF